MLIVRSELILIVFKVMEVCLAELATTSRQQPGLCSVCFTVLTHLGPRHRNPWQSFLRLCYSAKLSTRAPVAVCSRVYPVVKLL